ncbi:hypothetical protein SAMN06265379_103303 [Saccharicrinis carchari]|uniref:PQQ-like domain-containing protein n=1 Tax=Saccharicrinis carchari TaxID=1168039 RepID=A0A521CMM5_SACCC|nr:hypothetical protein [Saccharicrinis carchari]SMO60697.1 hypothetical protein SAMN06265379_103303 [Saccharicrinis carchari]
MSRKIVTALWLLVLTGLLVFAYFHFSTLKNFKNNQTIKAVPTDASLILQIQNPKNLIGILLNDVKYMEALQAFAGFKVFNAHLNSLQNDSVFNTGLIRSLKSKALTISFHPLGKNNVCPLYTYALNNQAEENKILSFLDENTGGWIIDKRKYNTSPIYAIKLKGRQGQVFASFYRGILMASSSSILVENALRQLRTEFSLLEDTTFNKLFKTSGNNTDANIFINFERLPEALSPAFKHLQSKKLGFVKNIASWGELDVNLNDNHLLINGFLYSAQYQSKINTLFEGMSANSSKINNVIPDNTSFMLSYSFDHSRKLKDRLMTYLKQNNQFESYTIAYNKLKLRGKQNEVEKRIFELIDKEFAYLICHSNDVQGEDDKYLIVKTQSKSKTLKLLGELTDETLVPVSFYQLDAQTKQPIYSSQSSAVFPLMLRTYCPDSPQKFFTFIDNYLVFADSQKQLSNIVYANILNKTLQNSKYHNEFSNRFAYKENAFVYIDFSKAKNLLPTTGKHALFNPSKPQQEALNKFYGAGIQLTAANDLLYVNACIEYMPQRQSEPETVWQSGLDSTIIGKPSLMINHYTREREIMVQDKSNMLYLISNSGRILWKKKLGSPILGEISQIDYYRNNKLQYLFNTANRIYLLDRNGNNVDKYPIELTHKATNPIAIFDYDNNRNYRIFVACANKQTYAYDKTGKLVTGWNAKPTEGTVSLPLQHFRTNGNDYIAFADNKRNYILNRRGKERVKLKSDFVRNTNSSFYLVTKNNHTYLSTTDTKGNLQLINLSNGDVKQQTLLNSSQEHFYLAYDMSSKNGTESILVSGDKVMAFAASGKKIFELKIDGKLLPAADTYFFSSNNKKIGVFDAQNNKIYLINSDGNLYKNFPLRGKSRFSIGFLNKKSTKFNLIVGGENNYLYNYEVK